ncbi:siderophore-interacting protein [Falsirhodobacter sp. alg1]|uniref:siderophore-interacting protein n=1 Tax=Falsirhodobacter sp. alg1 TaxID=1472418 RepID=UPI00078761BA|nr:siderophore-interacting protein [Falsirhodobacter sp. alg1]
MERTTAILDIPAATFLPGLIRRAAEIEAPVQVLDRGTRVQTHYGLLDVFEDGERIQVELSSKDSVNLLYLRDTLDWHLGLEGLKHCITWARMRAGANPANMVLGHCESVTAVSPSFIRVRVRGDYSRFLDGGLHFRLLIAAKGSDWPYSDETGGTVWPSGVEAWHRPAYTIRHICPHGLWMEFDIFRHEGGRVNDWAATLQEGEEVALTGPGGTGLTEAPWIGLVGDETAMPAIIRMIEGAPLGTQGVATIVVPSAADVQPVSCPEGIQLTWAFRDQGASVMDVFRAMQVPEGPRYVYVAAEKSEAALAREHAKALGLKRGESHALAYWAAGEE